MAAAASWSRSRGVAGVRATTGLFSIFTLLCLVCLSSSQTLKDQLEKEKELFQKNQKLLDELKAINVPAMDAAKHDTERSLSAMESTKALLKAMDVELSDDAQKFVQEKWYLAEKAKNFVDEIDEKLRAKIKEFEKEQEILIQFITSHAEKQAEL